MRLHAQTATIENGFVHLPTSAPLAGRLPARTHDLPQRSPRRPGRLDRAGDRLDEAATTGMGHVRMVAAKVRSAPVDLNVVTPMVRLLAPVGMAYFTAVQNAVHGVSTLTIPRRPNRDADRRRRRAAQASGMVRGALGGTAVADHERIRQDRHSTIIRFWPSPDPNETITRSAGRVMLMAVQTSLCRPRDALEAESE